MSISRTKEGVGLNIYIVCCVSQWEEADVGEGGGYLGR